MDEWLIEDCRKRLICQGAVHFFPEPSEADQAAMRADRGFSHGIPGAGLYTEGGNRYHLRLHVGKLASGEDQGDFTVETWSKRLAANEPRARYRSHHIERGAANSVGHYCHVIVQFEIVD